MDSEKIINIINQNSNLNLDFKQYKFINKRKEITTTDLNPYTFQLLDWEKKLEEDYDDNIEMTEKEIKKVVKNIYKDENL